MDCSNYSPTLPFDWEEPDINDAVDVLINFLNERDSWQSPMTYIVKEVFNLKENTYELINLTIEKDIESKWIVGHDIEWILPDINKVLTNIQLDSIAYIHIDNTSNNISIIISLLDGHIEIHSK